MKTFYLFGLLLLIRISLPAQTPAKVLDNANPEEVKTPSPDTQTNRAVQSAPLVIGTMTTNAFEESVIVPADKINPNSEKPEVVTQPVLNALPPEKK